MKKKQVTGLFSQHCHIYFFFFFLNHELTCTAGQATFHCVVALLCIRGVVDLACIPSLERSIQTAFDVETKLLLQPASSGNDKSAWALCLRCIDKVLSLEIPTHVRKVMSTATATETEGFRLLAASG